MSGSRREGEGGLIKYSDVGLAITLIRQSELPYSGLTVHLCLHGRYFTETKLHISKTRMEILFPCGGLFCVFSSNVPGSLLRKEGMA